MYVFHIASLYDRLGDGTEGADMIGHSTKLVLIYLHVVIGNTNCIMTMYDDVIIGGKITAREYTSEKGDL